MAIESAFACVARGATYYASSSHQVNAKYNWYSIVIGSQETFPTARKFFRASLLLFALTCLPASGLGQQSSNTSISSAGSDSASLKTSVTKTLVDSSIPDDPDVTKMLGPYRAKVAELEVVIGRLQGVLKKGGVGAGSLGNFVTGGLREEISRELGK